MSNTIRSLGQQALRDALKAARLSAGLSQSELAQRLKCHQSLVARLESGERRVDVVEIVVLARALDVLPKDLFEQISAKVPVDQRI